MTIEDFFSWLGLLVAYQSVRLYHWFAIQFRFLFHPSRVYTTVQYMLLFPDHTELQGIVPRDLPAEVLVVESIEQHTMTGRTRKACVLRPNNPENPFTPCQPPWWFIGAKLRSGEEVCITDTLAPFLVPGNVITRRLLDLLCPEISQNNMLSRWFYLDPTSFEEREFPADGITVRPDVVETPIPDEPAANHGLRLRTPVLNPEDEDDDIEDVD